jgi:hypothetical protein
MNVVFLSPHFPPNFFNFCVRLRQVGANVLGIADASYDALRPELRDALTEYYRVEDMHDFDAMTRALGYFTWRYGHLDRIDSLNEYWLETEARLRTEFGIPGIRAEEIDRVKRKSRMKRVFERAGLAVPRGRVCRNGPEARRFVEEVGFPIIAKPDVGVGAARTYRLDTDEDLEAYLGDKPALDYILEEAISGPIVTYDGLIDREGEVVFSSTLQYSTGVLESVRGADIYYWIAREIPEDLEDAGQRTVAAFGVKERPFHFEYFRSEPDGELVALEVNMRPPGGLTVDMFDYANDFDFYRMWAEVVASGTTPTRTERPWWCFYVGRKPNHQYRLSHDEVLERFGDVIVHHERIDDVFATAIGSYGYILRDEDEEPLHEAAREIQEVAA